VAMSASGPDPSWQLPLPPDSGPEQRRVKPAHLLLGTLLALALLCCGGAVAVEVFTSGKSGKTGAAAGIKDPAVPSDDPATPAAKTAAAKTAATTSPAPSGLPSKSAKPKPATRKPTTRPTTGPPTRTPAPTPTPTATTPVLPIVRAGAFCAPVGAFGITARGKLMRCTRESEDERPRWRAVRSQGLDL
jgi:cell division septation protein DedD